MTFVYAGERFGDDGTRACSDGLSLLVWGRLGDLVTSRSASRWATGLAIIGVPRRNAV